MQPLTVIGAYGRDYKTSEDALKAWHAGDSFVLLASWRVSYINKKTTEGIEIWIQYNRDRNKCRAQ